MLKFLLYYRKKSKTPSNDPMLDMYEEEKNKSYQVMTLQFGLSCSSVDEEASGRLGGKLALSTPFGAKVP